MGSGKSCHFTERFSAEAVALTWNRCGIGLYAGEFTPL